jgi:hypothetical protein
LDHLSLAALAIIALRARRGTITDVHLPNSPGGLAIHGNPSRLILAEQLGCRSSARFILEIIMDEHLSVVVTNSKTSFFCR